MTKQNWLSAISNMLQFILGFVLGVALIGGSAVGVAYYYFKKVSSNVPEKPIYAEEKSPTTDVVKNQEPKASQEQLQTDTEADFNSNSEAEPTPEPEPEPVAEPELPPNAYYANVTWPQGLSLRAEPSLNGERIGGIGYNAKILILEESADKQWQKVQIPESEQEGWVKAGNVKKVSD